MPLSEEDIDHHRADDDGMPPAPAESLEHDERPTLGEALDRFLRAARGR